MGGRSRPNKDKGPALGNDPTPAQTNRLLSALESGRQLQAEIDGSRTGPADALIGDQAGQRPSDFSEIGVAQRRVRIGERRGVGEVRRLCTELQLDLLGDLEFAEKREIEVAEPGAGEVITAGVA